MPDSIFPWVSTTDKVSCCEGIFIFTEFLQLTIRSNGMNKASVNSWALWSEFGKWMIYHSGDTLLYENIVDMLNPFNIDLAFLPINGNDPSRGVAGNLSCTEAAELGHQLGVRLVIPHHYHMFEFNTADPDDFAAEARTLSQPFRILKLGEHLVFPM